MMKTLVFIVANLLAIAQACYPQQELPNRFIVGFSVFTPRVTGMEDGPTMVMGNLTSSDGVTFSHSFVSNSLFGVWLGPWIDELQTFLVVSFRYVQIGKPSPASGMEFEISGRYVFWKYGLTNLAGIVSVKNCSYTSSDNPFQHGYNFGGSFWLPGIGLGANFSVIHGEVLIYGWPHSTVIGYAAEANGIQPGMSNLPGYASKPIYLRYAVSLTVGIEFAILSF
jgi:hypothetical protein